MTEFAVAATHDRLHHAVTDWLRTAARTPWPLAWKTGDLVVAEKTDYVVYLTAAQLLEYRDRALAISNAQVLVEYVRGS